MHIKRTVKRIVAFGTTLAIVATMLLSQATGVWAKTTGTVTEGNSKTIVLDGTSATIHYELYSDSQTGNFSFSSGLASPTNDMICSTTLGYFITAYDADGNIITVDGKEAEIFLYDKDRLFGSALYKEYDDEGKSFGVGYGSVLNTDNILNRYKDEFDPDVSSAMKEAVREEVLYGAGFFRIDSLMTYAVSAGSNDFVKNQTFLNYRGKTTEWGNATASEATLLVSQVRLLNEGKLSLTAANIRSALKTINNCGGTLASIANKVGKTVSGNTITKVSSGSVGGSYYQIGCLAINADNVLTAYDKDGKSIAPSSANKASTGWIGSVVACCPGEGVTCDGTKDTATYYNARWGADYSNLTVSKCFPSEDTVTSGISGYRLFGDGSSSKERDYNVIVRFGNIQPELQSSIAVYDEHDMTDEAYAALQNATSEDYLFPDIGDYRYNATYEARASDGKILKSSHQQVYVVQNNNEKVKSKILTSDFSLGSALGGCSASVTEVDSAGFTVELSVPLDPQSGYSYGGESFDTLTFPVWTSNNGQDDIVWYKISGVVDSEATCRVFSLRVLFSEHGDELGAYNIHVYAYRDRTSVGSGALPTVQLDLGDVKKQVYSGEKVLIQTALGNTQAYDRKNWYEVSASVSLAGTTTNLRDGKSTALCFLKSAGTKQAGADSSSKTLWSSWQDSESQAYSATEWIAAKTSANATVNDVVNATVSLQARLQYGSSQNSSTDLLSTHFYSIPVIQSDLETGLRLEITYPDGTEETITVYRSTADNGSYYITRTLTDETGYATTTYSDNMEQITIPRGSKVQVYAIQKNNTATVVAAEWEVDTQFVTAAGEGEQTAVAGDVIAEMYAESVQYVAVGSEVTVGANSSCIYTAKIAIDNGLGFTSTNYAFESRTVNNEVSIEIVPGESSIETGVSYIITDSNQNKAVVDTSLQGSALYNDGKLYSGERVTADATLSVNKLDVEPAVLSLTSTVTAETDWSGTNHRDVGHTAFFETLKGQSPAKDLSLSVMSGSAAQFVVQPTEDTASFIVPKQDTFELKTRVSAVDEMHEGYEETFVSDTAIEETDLRAVLLIVDYDDKLIYRAEGDLLKIYAITDSDSFINAVQEKGELVRAASLSVISIQEHHSVEAYAVYLNDTNASVALCYDTYQSGMAKTTGTLVLEKNASVGTTQCLNIFVDSKEGIFSGTYIIGARICINNGLGFADENYAYESDEDNNETFVAIQCVSETISPSYSISDVVSVKSGETKATIVENVNGVQTTDYNDGVVYSGEKVSVQAEVSTNNNESITAHNISLSALGVFANGTGRTVLNSSMPYSYTELEIYPKISNSVNDTTDVSVLLYDNEKTASGWKTQKLINDKVTVIQSNLAAVIFVCDTTSTSDTVVYKIKKSAEDLYLIETYNSLENAEKGVECQDSRETTDGSVTITQKDTCYVLYGVENQTNAKVHISYNFDDSGVCSQDLSSNGLVTQGTGKISTDSLEDKTYSVKACLNNGEGFTDNNYEYESASYDNELTVTIKLKEAYVQPNLTTDYEAIDFNKTKITDKTVYSGQLISLKFQYTENAATSAEYFLSDKLSWGTSVSVEGVSNGGAYISADTGTRLSILKGETTEILPDTASRCNYLRAKYTSSSSEDITITLSGTLNDSEHDYSVSEEHLLTVLPSDVEVSNIYLYYASNNLAVNGEVYVGDKVIPVYVVKNNSEVAVDVCVSGQFSNGWADYIPDEVIANTMQEAGYRMTLEAGEEVQLIGEAVVATGDTLSFMGKVVLADTMYSLGYSPTMQESTSFYALFNDSDITDAFTTMTGYEINSANNVYMRTNTVVDPSSLQDSVKTAITVYDANTGDEMQKIASFYVTYSGATASIKYQYNSNYPEDMAIFTLSGEMSAPLYRSLLSTSQPFDEGDTYSETINGDSRVAYFTNIKNTNALPDEYRFTSSITLKKNNNITASVTTNMSVYPVNLKVVGVELVNAVTGEVVKTPYAGDKLMVRYTFLNESRVKVPVKITVGSGTTQYDAYAAYEKATNSIEANVDAEYLAANEKVVFYSEPFTVSLTDRYIGAYASIYIWNLDCSYETNQTDNENIQTWQVGEPFSVSFIKPNAEYHTDVDVYSSYTVTNNTGYDIDASMGIIPHLTVTQDYVDSIEVDANALIVPAKETTTVWFRWHTTELPASNEVTLTMDVDPTAVLATKAAERTDVSSWAIYLTATVQTYDTMYSSELSGAYGRLVWQTQKSSLDKTQSYYTLRGDDTITVEQHSNGWDYWTVDENGQFVKQRGTYYLGGDLQVNMFPANQNYTMTDGNGHIKMRSGYGFTIEVTGYAVDSDTETNTGIQNAYALYPEFLYDTVFGPDANAFYNLMPGYQILDSWVDCLNGGYFGTFSSLVKSKDGAKLTLPLNPGNKSNIHYTPIWLPDTDDYTVWVYVYDVWTPGGMLSGYVSSNTLVIEGDLYDDYYIHSVHI